MIETFYKNNKDRLLKKLNKILYNKDVAEDILQDAFVRAVEKQHQYDPKRGHISTWFNLLLYSTLRNHQRDYKREPTFLEFLDEVDYSKYADPADFDDDVPRQIVAKVHNETHRAVLFSFYVLGYKAKDVAELYDLSTSNVTTICNRFKKLVGDK